MSEIIWNVGTFYTLQQSGHAAFRRYWVFWPSIILWAAPWFLRQEKTVHWLYLPAFFVLALRLGLIETVSEIFYIVRWGEWTGNPYVKWKVNCVVNISRIRKTGQFFQCNIFSLQIIPCPYAFMFVLREEVTERTLWFKCPYPSVFGLDYPLIPQILIRKNIENSEYLSELCRWVRREGIPLLNTLL